MKLNVNVKILANNHCIIETEEGTYLQSYDSIIAFSSNEGKITLDEYFWDYSKTTRKHLNSFLNENKKETEKKIKTGEYTLANLN